MSSNVLTLITVWRLFKFAAEAPVSADALVGVAVWIWAMFLFSSGFHRDLADPAVVDRCRATSPTGLLAPAESVFLRL